MFVGVQCFTYMIVKSGRFCGDNYASKIGMEVDVMDLNKTYMVGWFIMVLKITIITKIRNFMISQRSIAEYGVHNDA